MSTSSNIEAKKIANRWKSNEWKPKKWKRKFSHHFVGCQHPNFHIHFNHYMNHHKIGCIGQCDPVQWCSRISKMGSLVSRSQLETAKHFNYRIQNVMHNSIHKNDYHRSKFRICVFLESLWPNVSNWTSDRFEYVRIW